MMMGGVRELDDDDDNNLAEEEKANAQHLGRWRWSWKGASGHTGESPTQVKGPPDVGAFVDLMVGMVEEWIVADSSQDVPKREDCESFRPSCDWGCTCLLLLWRLD